MTGNKYGSPRGGLPPPFPNYNRRGSNPIEDQKSPNRSRSLDGLLDTDSRMNFENHDENPSETTLSCENLLQVEVNEETGEGKTDKCVNSKNTKSHSVGDGVDDKSDKSSNLSLHSSSSESKRKKNFMDRCVNKVRSFIKK